MLRLRLWRVGGQAAFYTDQVEHIETCVYGARHDAAIQGPVFKSLGPIFLLNLAHLNYLNVERPIGYFLM